MKMTVIGTGYLGATHAACMAEMGHEVLGVDVDAAKIAALSAGEVPFFEPGLAQLLAKHTASGRLRFSTELADAAAFGTVHFIGVGTPQQRGSFAADVRYVDAAVTELAKAIGETPGHLIVGKSTVPVGTAQRLQTLVGEHIEVCWNPEFLREGHAVDDTLRPDRIVVGQRDGSSAAEILREIYRPETHDCPFLVTDLATAELVKVSANAFLATKISFINAVGEICEAAGADVVQLAQALGLDDRIGPKFLGAGLGFGGGCLPKDIRAFMARAGELGANEALTFLREVDAINLRRRERMVQLTRKACGGSLIGANVTVLGAAFKPNSDDVRDSPALAVAGALSLAGAQVSVFDPKAMANAAKVYPTLHYADSAMDALANADAVVLATEWAQFVDLDPVAAGEKVRNKVLLDGRNVMDVEKWRAAGWTVQALGRSLH